jgi:glycine dehydrogenase
MEALLNFQTMITDLTGLDIANASLLDEATAAAEAMTLCLHACARPEARKFFAADSCHPQTLAVLETRAKPLGIEIVQGSIASAKFDDSYFGAIAQYPATDGTIEDVRSFIQKAQTANVLTVLASDILALTLLASPGELGVDVAVGSTQRFGVPPGFGGPHAAYFATRDAHKRSMPGRLIGVSKDAQGRPALRLSLQTREQHIRRDKATSNICTAQVLLAVMASMYAVYHGAEGLRDIARRVARLTRTLADALTHAGHTLKPGLVFDTLRVTPKQGATEVLKNAQTRGINLRDYADGTVGISLDETVTPSDLADLAACFGASISVASELPLYGDYQRVSSFLTHPVFNTHHTETEMLRYIRRLEARDLTLTTSMIPLGSCTMKLNASTEMFPVTWPEFGSLHPFAPADQAKGYAALAADLQRWLAEITGLPGVSLQPNSGAAGEYAGLLAVRNYHDSRGDHARTVCLIPTSAHGTNPASAVMAGFTVVPVACDTKGNIDVADLRAKATEHAAKLGALMVTYPSTHGVFEETIVEICSIVHALGGQVYMDGANMNAQVGLCRPGDMGVDVCHLNLHKTFCIPHGGGGPGVGPICVTEHLKPFLPVEIISNSAFRIPSSSTGPVSAAPLGSASILVISWAYITMLGAEGLTQATKIAILNANYIAQRLHPHYPVLYRGVSGLVAHECILDLRAWKAAGVEVEDVAKRLMDYGFHAPTMSWPVAGTLMVEPTESESPAELDRFCDAMIAIREEIEAVLTKTIDPRQSPLKHAPHTADVVTAETWDRPYSRQTAAFPAPWTREHKYWPTVGRVDNVYGDRNLICSCLPVESYVNG